MISVRRTMDANVTRIYLSGTIVEDTDLLAQIGPLQGKVHFHCGHITRVNSAGTRSWIRAFQKLAAQKIDMEFHELSPAIIQLQNYFRGVLALGKIASVVVPFLCSSCGTEDLRVYTSDSLRKAGFQVADIPCKKCGKPARFDEIGSEYFAILNRSG
jgi:hypothetical protein